MKRAPAILFLLVLMVGCTDSESPEVEAPDEEPTPSTVIPYEADLDPIPDGTEEGTATGLYRVMTADRGSDTVGIVVMEGGCLDLRRVEVEEQEGSVHIRAVMRTLVAGNVTCQQDLRPKPLTVTLEAPLGDRAVIGGCTPSEENIAGRQCDALGYVEP